MLAAFIFRFAKFTGPPLFCSDREMKRCASDMSEDDSTGNVVLPDGGGKKAVSRICLGAAKSTLFR